MTQENQPIVVNLPEGQNTLTLLNGKAPEQLDQLAPIAIHITGTLYAPLEFLKHRVGDIDQHKAHILVCRDNLSITLFINETDAYIRGKVCGLLKYSSIFTAFGINTDKKWQPEQLGQFLKLNRSHFTNLDDNMKVVNALKTFDAKVNQTVTRSSQENGNRAIAFRQAVDSNIPDKFKLRLPIFAGGYPQEIEVETFANIDGVEVTIGLQSPGANDTINFVRNNDFDDIIEKLREVAPEIVIIEQ